jgi:SAM-dependent methyltransferase
MNSYYYIPKKYEENSIDYKSWVGGMWEEIGNLQKYFLISQGLTPDSKFLDIGCGCLRAGEKLIPFLNDNNYYGQDINSYLISIGIQKVIPQKNLHHKITKENFCVSEDFSLSFSDDVKFDMAISQSVFTHLPLNHLYMCLLNIKNYFKPKSKFFVTFWIVPDDHDLCEKFIWKNEIITSHITDPFHYKKSQIKSVLNDPLISQFWDFEYIGDWNHPRNQKMFCFIKK